MLKGFRTKALKIECYFFQEGQTVRKILQNTKEISQHKKSTRQKCTITSKMFPSGTHF